MQEIYQKTGNEIRGYKIVKDGVEAEVKTNGEHNFFKIKYEDIEFDEMISARKPSPVEIGLFLSVFANLLLLMIVLSDWLQLDPTANMLSIFAFALLSGISFLAINIFRMSKEKILRGPQSLSFFYKPNEEEKINAFINSLKSSKKDYMRKTYMYIDDYKPKERQKQVFMWLFENTFISKTELDLLVEELNNRSIIDGD